MKHQIERFSPHQNAKVFAVLMALSSLVLLVPFFGFTYISAPPQARPPLWFVVFMPVLYLVFGYVMVVVGCWFYNIMFRYIGGIEFTTRSDAA